MLPKTNKSLFPLLLIGGAHLPLSFLIKYAVASLVLNSNEDLFSGISGLAVGLALNFFLSIIAVFGIALLAGYLLKRFGYSRPYLLAVVASIIIYVFSGSINVLSVELPVYIYILIGILLGAFSYLISFVLLISKLRLALKIAFLAIFLLVFRTGVVSLDSYNYDATNKNQKINRKFELYAPSSSFFNEHSIKNSDEITVQHASTEINTPRGKIKVRQAFKDTNLNNLFYLLTLVITMRLKSI